MARLAPYGSKEYAHIASKAGDKGKTPRSLATRMPSPEIAAKVGDPSIKGGVKTHRVVRRNARG